MNWINITNENRPPLGVQVLVEYKTGGYDVFDFESHPEYGYRTSNYDNYLGLNEFKRYCLIEP